MSKYFYTDDYYPDYNNYYNPAPAPNPFATQQQFMSADARRNAANFQQPQMPMIGGNNTSTQQVMPFSSYPNNPTMPTMSAAPAGGLNAFVENRRNQPNQSQMVPQFPNAAPQWTPPAMPTPQQYHPQYYMTQLQQSGIPLPAQLDRRNIWSGETTISAPPIPPQINWNTNTPIMPNANQVPTFPTSIATPDMQMTWKEIADKNINMSNK